MEILVVLERTYRDACVARSHSLDFAYACESAAADYVRKYGGASPPSGVSLEMMYLYKRLDDEAIAHLFVEAMSQVKVNDLQALGDIHTGISWWRARDITASDRDRLYMNELSLALVQADLVNVTDLEIPVVEFVDISPTDTQESTEEIGIGIELDPKEEPLLEPESVGEYGLDFFLEEFGINPRDFVDVRFKYGREHYALQTVTNFLGWIIERNSLPIGEYFSQIPAGESVFLVAATGLGKTVTLPVYLLAQLLVQVSAVVDSDYSPVSPRVWVVVPTIAIASECNQFLNSAYYAYLEESGISPKHAQKTPLFGYRSGSGTDNTRAPIQFVTSGILPLLAQDEQLSSELDRILIDEAHKTLVVDEGIELGLVALQERNFVVSYMSATVDTQGLSRRLNTTIVLANEERYPKYIHNSPADLVTTATEAIRVFFMERDYESPFYPRPDYSAYTEVLAGVDARGRASGIMIVMDSIKGPRSDAAALQEALGDWCDEHGIEIILFSSAIRDTKSLFTKYTRQFEKIREQCGQYVLITTNVVEMGVTFPDLDMVITKDTEIVNRMVAGHLTPVCVPLSAASFYQRAGRVGRKRAGLVAIAREMGTEFSTLTDEQINTQGLALEPIRFPLQRYEPYKLAYQVVRQGLSTPPEIWDYLDSLGLPSIDNEADMAYVLSMTLDLTKLYRGLGIDDPANSEWVRLCERWVGTPQYPFYLTGLVEMERFRAQQVLIAEAYAKAWRKKNPGATPYKDPFPNPLETIFAYPFWYAFMYMGNILEYPASRLRYRPRKEKPGETLSEVEKHPPERPQWVYGYAHVPYSELVTNARLLSNHSYHNIDRKKLKYYKAATIHSDYQEKTEEVIANTGWKPYAGPKAKFAAFEKELEVFERLKKDGFDNPLFFQANSDFFSLDDDFTEFGEDNSIGSKSYRIIEQLSPGILYRGLLTIYQAAGVSFQVTAEINPEHGLYEITYERHGDTCTEQVYQRDHYVDLVVGDEYYGLLMPETRQQQTEIHLRMQHYFKV